MHSPCSPMGKPPSRPLPCGGIQLLLLSSRGPPDCSPPSTVSGAVGSQPRKEPGREAAGSFPELRRPQPPEITNRVGGLRAQGLEPQSKG